MEWPHAFFDCGWSLLCHGTGKQSSRRSPPSSSSSRCSMLSRPTSVTSSSTCPPLCRTSLMRRRPAGCKLVPPLESTPEPRSQSKWGLWVQMWVQVQRLQGMGQDGKRREEAKRLTLTRSRRSWPMPLAPLPNSPTHKKVLSFSLPPPCLLAASHTPPLPHTLSPACCSMVCKARRFSSPMLPLPPPATAKSLLASMHRPVPSAQRPGQARPGGSSARFPDHALCLRPSRPCVRAPSRIALTAIAHVRRTPPQAPRLGGQI
jgi:hypothetical protein